MLPSDLFAFKQRYGAVIECGVITCESVSRDYHVLRLLVATDGPKRQAERDHEYTKRIHANRASGGDCFYRVDNAAVDPGSHCTAPRQFRDSAQGHLRDDFWIELHRAASKPRGMEHSGSHQFVLVDPAGCAIISFGLLRVDKRM